MIFADIGFIAVVLVYFYGFTPMHLKILSGLSLLTIILLPFKAFRSSKSSSGILDDIGTTVIMIVALSIVTHRVAYSLRESFVDELKTRVETSLLKDEKDTAHSLLESMLPSSVISQLKKQRHNIAETFDGVTILFCEISNFADWYSSVDRFVEEESGGMAIKKDALEPQEIVSVLNIVFNVFDSILDAFPILRKVETVCAVNCT